ncbi:GNAT family N-acetyltransferase [Brooklawnia cerclae]|uniref:Ribosomal protein S18 acetylase RimI-like enzyme n=1 Tax=Brooklawnia cerclae TaxID=349934 RepID=A0ABX0SDK9_9ACTN|nr:GNAT family N-acetyltransferase [Brooklawnia cerclae]NIH56095.1 ribosomal protein S18 acetylase RimI-like enzyme [Brooklawnia cerclae]
MADIPATDGWLVRPARPDDAKALGRLHAQGWQQGYRGLLPDSYLDALDEAAAVRTWRDRLTEPHGLRVLVAQDEAGTALGFTSIGPCFDPDAAPGELEIWDMWVDAGHHRNGIGGALLVRALALAPAEAEVVVWVLADNVRALAFYKRNRASWDGLRRTSERTGGVRVTDVRLRWAAGVRPIVPGPMQPGASD